MREKGTITNPSAPGAVPWIYQYEDRATCYIQQNNPSAPALSLLLGDGKEGWQVNLPVNLFI